MTPERWFATSVSACIAAWGIAAIALSASGTLERFSGGGLLLWGLVVPPGLFLLLYKVWTRFRQFILSLPLRPLTAAQTPRVIGGSFLLWELWAGMMNNGFAMPTGVSDIFFGLTAIPVALGLTRGPEQPKRGFGIWHAFSLGFLLLSSTSGIITSPVALTFFPASLVPVFLGPMMIVLEIAASAKLLSGRPKLNKPLAASKKEGGRNRPRPPGLSKA